MCYRPTVSHHVRNTHTVIGQMGRTGLNCSNMSLPCKMHLSLMHHLMIIHQQTSLTPHPYEGVQQVKISRGDCWCGACVTCARWGKLCLLQLLRQSHLYIYTVHVLPTEMSKNWH